MGLACVKAISVRVRFSLDKLAGLNVSTKKSSLNEVKIMDVYIC